MGRLQDNMGVKFSRKLKRSEVNLIVYDFDGVMTDNRVLVFENGMEAVIANRGDGLGIAMINKMDIPQIILSTEKNQVVFARAKKLGLEALHGVDNKLKKLSEYCQKGGYNPVQVVYVGNDTNDLEAMQFVGLPVAPSDANEEILKIAKLITRAPGGFGVVRELAARIV